MFLFPNNSLNHVFLFSADLFSTTDEGEYIFPELKFIEHKSYVTTGPRSS